MKGRRSSPTTIALALGVTCATSIFACSATAQSRTTPDWVRRPVIDSYEAYPEFALMLGIEGIAVATCRIWEEGPPRDCAVNASPPGMGFEAAAMDFLAGSVMHPATEDGVVVRGVQVAIPIAMRIDDTYPGAPYTGPEPEDAKVALAMTIAQVIIGLQPFNLEDLDEDRREGVLAIIEDAKRADMEPITRTLALGLARSYNLDQLEMMARTAPAAEEAPAFEDFEEWMAFLGYMGILEPADPASFDPAWYDHMLVMKRFFDSVRTQYCALYGCSLEPPRPPYLSSGRSGPP